MFFAIATEERLEDESYKKLNGVDIKVNENDNM